MACTWTNEFDPTLLEGVNKTSGYGDILSTLPDSALLMLGDSVQPTFINYNNSCHVDSTLELVFNLDCWYPELTNADSNSGFGINPLLKGSVLESIRVQEGYHLAEDSNTAGLQMSRARDDFLLKLSPLTGTRVGDIGSCGDNLFHTIICSGTGSDRFGLLPLTGVCPGGATVALTGLSKRYALDGGWILRLPPTLLHRYCVSRGDITSPINIFDVMRGVFNGIISIRSISKLCSCPQCKGATVAVDCFVDRYAIEAGGVAVPVPPPVLLVDCRDLDKSFLDAGASPFRPPRPLKSLSTTDGYLSFGTEPVHFKLIGVARHIGVSSKRGHWNCDVYQPGPSASAPAKGWFHAENLTGQSTSLSRYKDDRSCSVYMWLLDDK